MNSECPYELTELSGSKIMSATWCKLELHELQGDSNNQYSVHSNNTSPTKLHIAPPAYLNMIFSFA